MDAAGLVRAARRGVGEGQLAFAARAGVSTRTLSSLESGRSDPRWSTIVQLLAAGGLELTAVPLAPEPPDPLVGYLHRSTSERLRHGVTGAWQPRPANPVWAELCAVTRFGQVRLDGVAAAGVWVPAPGPVDRLAVEVHLLASTQLQGLALWRRGPPPAEPVSPVPEQFPHLAITCAGSPAPAGHVRVALWGGHVHVPPPLLLAAHPDCAALAEPLRMVAGLLHDDRWARDYAGRRGPAHRDPDEWAERHLVMLRWQHDDRELPSETESRAWRLGSTTSLASWLQRHPERRWW